MPAMPAALDVHGGAVEEALQAALAEAGREGLPLYRMMRYHLGWVDKDGLETHQAPQPRLLGCLTLEAAMFLSRGTDAAFAAAAVELFASSVAVHEDMQSANSDDEERPAIWWVWGPAQAINVGDGLHAVARLTLLRLGSQQDGTARVVACVGELDEMALRYYEGQYIDLTHQERIDVTLEQHSRMVRLKLGSLVGGSLALGAAAAGSEGTVIAAFRGLGETLGEAIQIRRDLDAFVSKATPDGRILNKSKLYPVVDILQNGSPRQKRAIGTIYFKRVIDESDFQNLRVILEDGGAFQRTLGRLRELEAATMHLVHELPPAGTDTARFESIVHEILKPRGVAGGDDR